jgi:Putative adhesin
MNIRSYRSHLLFTLALALVSSLGWAQDQGQDQGREFHWKGKLAPENVVMIKNVNGNIDAEPATGDEVEVTAEKSGPRADEVRIEMVQLSDGVMFCAIYPGWFTQHCNEGHTSNSHSGDTKVHFTVRVPENIRLHAENVNGGVTAEHMGRFVHTSSVNGSVRVSTKSWAELSTVNGSIEGSMGRADWNGTLKAESVNGSITLELPSDTNTDVDFASVNGRMQSEFPLSVSGKFGGRTVKGKIGSGGRELKVETVNGNVQLKEGSI